jgi:hypothetical protein
VIGKHTERLRTLTRKDKCEDCRHVNGSLMIETTKEC